MKIKSRSRFLAFALVLVLLVGIVPLAAMAVENHVNQTFTDNSILSVYHFQYKILSEDAGSKTGTVAVIGGSPVAKSLVISDTVTKNWSKTFWPEYWTYTVVAIGDSAFSNVTNVNTVRLPATLTSIGQNAFAGCSSLTFIWFSRTTAPSVGSDAFSGVPANALFSVPERCYTTYKEAMPEGSIVRERGYAVLLSESSLDFGNQIADYAPVASQMITITNVGVLDVTLKMPVDPYFDISLSSYFIPVGGTATMTVKPKAGLAVGTYNQTIKVEGTSAFVLNTAVSFDASFEVIAHTYTLSASSDVDFGTSSVDYAAAPDAQEVTVQNTGNTAVTLVQPTSTDFVIGALSATELNPGDSATFTVQPKDGLSVAPYSEPITVSNTNGESASVTATFEVVAGPAISSDVTAADFGSAVVDYAAAPDAQTVTITNSGHQDVTLTPPTSSNFTITTTDNLTLAPGESATFTIQPKTALAADTYAEALEFKADGQYGGSQTITVDASFEVLAHTYLLTASPAVTVDFGSLLEAYATAPDMQTVTVENTGNTAVTLTQPTSTDYVIGTLSKTELNPGESATFTVQPKTGLAVGTYTKTISITGSNGAITSVNVTFTVLEDYKYVTKVNDPSGVSVAGLMKTNAQLVISPLSLGSDAGSGSIRAMQSNSGYTFIEGWNISLTGDVKGSFTVTLPVDAKYNGQTLTILHAASSGLKTYSAVVADGKVSFTVTEFSPFAVFAKVDKAPYTGDSSSTLLWVLLGSLSAVGLVTTTTAVSRRKSREK